MKKRLFYIALAALPVMASVNSCSSNKAKVNPNTPAPAATVSIVNFAFVPDTVHIKAGQAVMWTNKDTAPHTTTELSGAFDSGTINTDQTFSFTFGTTGTYTYHCLVHPMMKNAVVIVSN